METSSRHSGAVQFGNFINYYNFNSAEDRIKLLPINIWISNEDMEIVNRDTIYLVLDVGCNSGVLTKLLYLFIKNSTKKNIYMLGIDIDPNLINIANRENNENDHIKFVVVDVMDDLNFNKQIKNFLKEHNCSKFDAICCFSITMWIHLNHHDSGMQTFLKKLSNIAKLLVIEPQPWKCYQTAERRLKKKGEVFPLFLDLKWRSYVVTEIEKFLENKLKRLKVYECPKTKWKRSIMFFR